MKGVYYFLTGRFAGAVYYDIPHPIVGPTYPHEQYRSLHFWLGADADERAPVRRNSFLVTSRVAAPVAVA